MLNYLRAELYKVLHRKYTYIFLIVMLLCETLLVAIYAFSSSNGEPITFISFSDGLYMLTLLLVAGLYATILMGDLVFSDQYKTGTLKNELSFGIPRGRVYGGKLIVQCVTAVILCAIMIIYYIGLSWFVLQHTEETLNSFKMVGWCLLSALPLWLGAQALSNMMYFLCKGSTAAALITVGVFIGLGNIFKLLALLVNQDLFSFLLNFLLTTPFDSAAGTVGDSVFMLKSWALGAGWFAVTTLIGLALFQKKEIN